MRSFPLFFYDFSLTLFLKSIDIPILCKLTSSTFFKINFKVDLRAYFKTLFLSSFDGFLLN